MGQIHRLFPRFGIKALALAESKTTDDELKFLLRETEAGLIDLPTQHGVSQGPRSSYSFRSHADTWTVRSVLGGRMNLALFETMPNLLIGFGLMCTFIFLAVALQQAGLALNALDVSARQQDQALQSLIATAGGKFITSIAGLLCSLVWNWRAKVALENLQSSIDTLCHTLRSKVPDNAAEASGNSPSNGTLPTTGVWSVLPVTSSRISPPSTASNSASSTMPIVQRFRVEVRMAVVSP